MGKPISKPKKADLAHLILNRYVNWNSFLFIDWANTHSGIWYCSFNPFFGCAILLETKISLANGSALCCFFALFHGIANGLEGPSNATGLLYIVGVILGSIALLSSGIILGSAYRYHWRNSIFPIDFVSIQSAEKE